MQPNKSKIGIVTDEVSRNLAEALDVSRQWGISRYEIREGSEKRTPELTPLELNLLDEVVSNGELVTALSPGVFKRPIEDRETIRDDLERRLPATMELAHRFNCPTIVIFGFEKMGDDSASLLEVKKTFESAAEAASREGLVLAIENEPRFWLDTPEDAMNILGDIDHPALRLNWDPANLHWGGTTPTRDHAEMLAPFIANLHVKDFTPDDERIPWRPLGEGITPWAELLAALKGSAEEGRLNISHYTIETHWEPLIEGSRRSLDHLLGLMEALGEHREQNTESE